MPALVGRGGTAVVVNGTGTGLTNTVGTMALAGNLSLSGAFGTTGAFNLTLALSASVTLACPASSDTLVGRATTDTLTNKTISGASNTLSNIGNAALTNSAITIGSSPVSLGGTLSTINGNLTFGGANAYGTAASIVLTNATGLPISTGITGLGAGVATFLATPTSANLAAAVTNETGSGALVFATSPTLVTPVLGAATATSLAASGAVTAGLGFTDTSFGTTTGYSGPGIQTNAATWFVINNSNGVALNLNGNSWVAYSDETMKTAFAPFVGALDKVAVIKTGTGRYLTDAGDISRSFISAQSVRAVLPEAVSVHEGNPQKPNAWDGKLMLSYTDIIPLLVAALAEAKARIEALEAK